MRRHIKVNDDKISSAVINTSSRQAENHPQNFIGFTSDYSDYNGKRKVLEKNLLVRRNCQLWLNVLTFQI